MTKKIAVVLTGCGFLDGSEIRESVATLWALSLAKAEFECFAPDAEQPTLVDHVTFKPIESSEKRNMMKEAARIARGKIKPLSRLCAKDFDGVIFPGGYGVAKNLSNFASKGSVGTICAEAQTVIDDFYQSKKPIGGICISPALIGLALKNNVRLELTLGDSKGASKEAVAEIEKLGHKHFDCKADEIHIDRQNKIVTTPAYMFDDAPLDDIFEGIKKLVNSVLLL